MGNITKQDILDAIRRTAKENNNIPLGEGRFEKETRIKRWDWNKYWARFGDAQKEAGFTPNKLQTAYSDEFIIEKISNLIRKLKKFPTQAERTVEKNKNSEFPSYGAIRRFAKTKEYLANKIIEYCKNKNKYEDILELCKPALESLRKDQNSDKIEADCNIGEVYLFKSGRYYKIGKTSDTVRRGKELRIQLPERTNLIHSIKTDDPSGVEAYWHKRFESKRMEGEWFNLDSTNIKAFKRWRRIV